MRKIGILGLILINISFILMTIYYFYCTYENYYVSPIPIVESVTVSEDNKINVIFNVPNKTSKRNKIYYLYTTEDKIPDVNDNWQLTTNNSFSFDLDKNVYYAYLKNEDDFIFKVNRVESLGKVTSLELGKSKVYLALDDSEKVYATYDTIGNISDKLTWYSEDNNVATVDQDGRIYAKNPGKTKVYAKLYDEIKYVDVTVTDLIVKRPREYDRSKPYLSCGEYTEEQNDLLDEILKARIDGVGYKTRAGAVEAARFLALELPYKIRYFSENGRGATNGVDGEGRYYHVGLYLHESRYDNIGKTFAGPKIWGCSLYSRPSGGKRSNGLDCSGFVSWVLLNGGFDVGDIGAGLDSHLDLTDYGERTRFNASVVNSGVVKVGDLLSSGGLQGGHIAIIVGEDDDYYYVAESLWTPPNVAVVIIPYDKDTIFNRYYYVMLMDDYYENDGKLTKMW